MKPSELKPFEFYIGNTIGGNYEFDVSATNDGIYCNNKIIATYDEDADINDYFDLCDVIDDAIGDCKLFNEETRNELGTYLAAEMDIKDWWIKNYGKEEISN